MNARVVIASCTPLPPVDPEHEPIISALAARGVSCEAVPWDDPGYDFGAADAVVIRSTWDYHLRRDAFLAWAKRVAEQTALWNPEPLVRWNSHKGYLRELSAKGIPTVPTEWVEQGTRGSFSELLAARGWTDVAIKPAVSAGGFETIRVSAADSARAQAHVDRVAALSDVMIQPYLRSVGDYGERSLIFIGGELSHAIRKLPQLETTNRDVSVDVTAVPVAPDEREVAERILRALQSDWLYARVDLARDDSGQPLLMELELIEPYLFLKHSDRGGERLADAIVKRL